MGKMAPTSVWYELASSIILYAYCYNNSYVDHGGRRSCDMQARLDGLAGLALGIEVLYNK